MTDIRLIDDENEKRWARLIFRLCNLDYNTFKEDELTREILELHLEEIISEIFSSMADNIGSNKDTFIGNYDYVDDILVGFQILGIFILRTGTYLPDIVRHAILFSTTWEYDRMRGWSRLLEEERKENLKKFRKAIIDHRPGRVIKIDF